MEAALTGTGQAVLDLHAFSRGMAYAAIKTALEEVRLGGVSLAVDHAFVSEVL